MGQCSSSFKEGLKEEFSPHVDQWSLAGRGDVAGLKTWLAEGGDPNGRDPRLTTLELPLHRAARYNQVDAMKVLLRGGAFVDVSSVSGTPLHCAARHGRVEAAELLLQRGADALALFRCKLPAVLAEEAGHAQLAALLRRAAQEQVQDPVGSAARLERRLQADTEVQARSRLIVAEEDEEVAELEQDIVRKSLGLEPALRFTLKTFFGRCEGGRIRDADAEAVLRAQPAA